MRKLFTTALALAALGAFACKGDVVEAHPPLVDLDRMPEYDMELPAPEQRNRAAEVYVPQDEIEVRGEEMTMPPMIIHVPIDETPAP